MDKHKVIPCLRQEDYYINMPTFPKFFYKCNKITIKLLTGFFEETDKLILKFIWTGDGLDSRHAVGFDPHSLEENIHTYMYIYIYVNTTYI